MATKRTLDLRVEYQRPGRPETRARGVKGGGPADWKRHHGRGLRGQAHDHDHELHALRHPLRTNPRK